MIIKIVKLINVVNKFNQFNARNRILRKLSISKTSYCSCITNRSCGKDRRSKKALRKIEENKNI